MHDLNQLSQNSFITAQESLLWRMIFSNQTIWFWYIKIKNFLNPIYCLSILNLNHLQEGRLRERMPPAVWKKCLFWKHPSVARIIQCFPPSLHCSQPRQGEASLPCEQGLQNSPFIIKAAKPADANRLPPFILNCKINFRGWGHPFCTGKSYISQLYALVAKRFLPRMGHNSRGVPPYSAFTIFGCRLQLHILDSSGFTN